MTNRNQGQASHRGENNTKAGTKKDAPSHVAIRRLVREKHRLGRCDILRCENDAFWTDSELILCDDCAEEARNLDNPK